MKKNLLKSICLFLSCCMILPAAGCDTSQSDGCLELTDAPTTTLDNVWYNPGGIFRCAIFDSLLTVNADMTSVTPSLAQSYDVKDNGSTVTFTLRDDVTWHDGETFDVEDVFFSVETVLRSDEVNGVIAAGLHNINGAEAYSSGEADSISGMTSKGNEITFNLVDNSVTFIQAIAQFAILPEHLL